MSIYLNIDLQGVCILNIGLSVCVLNIGISVCVLNIGIWNH